MPNHAKIPNTSEVGYSFVERYVANIIESAMDAIITIDETEHIILFNTAAETVFDCPRAFAIGKPLTLFIPARFRTTHGEHIRRFGNSAIVPPRMSTQRVVQALRLNGDEFPIEASISHTHQDGKRFYTIILRDVTERLNVETALRTSKEELEKLALAAHSAREEEKTRIARELHDELGQMLTALKIDTSWLRHHWPEIPEVIENKLDSMEDILNKTVSATRRISADLRPLMLDDLGLTAALEWLTQNFIQHTGIPCTLHIHDPDLNLNDPYATAVFRITQESLTNISKHAKATAVEINIQLVESITVLCIRDNGVGFAPSDLHKPNTYGLLGLKERAYLLGGSIEINSTPGQGTIILIQLPINHENLSPIKQKSLQ